MLKSKKWALLAGAMIVSMVISACQPQVVTQIVEREVTSVVERVETQVVEQTQVVEVEKEAYTTPHPILSDVRVRKAIAYCTNREELVRSVYGFLDDPTSLLMDTNIPKDHWAYNDNTEKYPFDPERGAALLDEAGWTLAEGATFRTNADGDVLALRFTTTNAQFRITWAAVFESNMADCGIQIIRLHAPGSWWFGSSTGLRRRDFELGAFAWVGEPDPDVQTLYACDQIPLPSNNWNGQNYMGWCNETASNAVKRGGNSLDRDERIAAYAEFQVEFAKDMISLPLFNRISVFAANKDFTTYQPGPGEDYPTYNSEVWEIPGKDTIVLAFTQEPATLFTLIESAYVATLASYLYAGQPYSSLNYEYTANHFFKQLPTVDNGGAVLNEVEPAAGSKIADADGNIVEAAAGVMVRNSAGETVEWAPGTKMNQLVVTFEVVPGLQWSDGEPFKAADMELGPKINCDPESGNVSFTLCEATEKWEYTDTTQTRTWVPGYTPAEYMIYYDLGYPSHQVLSDGRKLADVPAKEWSTLKEIAETPLGMGPYVVKEWVKGQQIVFEANPLFYKGAPKTPTVIIKFVADTNQAVAQLLTGEVDAVGSETLGAGAEVETVINECKKPDTTIVCFVEPSATWEHIDFNLFVR